MFSSSRTAQSYMLRWMPRWLQARSVQFLPDFALNDRSGLEALHTYVNQLPSLVELDLNAHLRLPFANHDHLIQEHQLDILVTCGFLRLLLPWHACLSSDPNTR